MKPSGLMLPAVLLMACSVPAFDYAIGGVNREVQAVRHSEHLSIVNGVAPAPFRYRILVPELSTQSPDSHSS